MFVSFGALFEAYNPNYFNLKMKGRLKYTFLDCKEFENFDLKNTFRELSRFDCQSNDLELQMTLFLSSSIVKTGV